MSNTETTKIAIRKRLFFEAARNSAIEQAHGFRWCMHCRGGGDVCVEHPRDKERWAAFEPCPDCKGEKIVAMPADTSAAADGT